jgi:hypothetical protein
MVLFITAAVETSNPTNGRSVYLLFIYGSFDEAVSISDYMALKG